MECVGYSTDQGVITCYNGVSMMVPYTDERGVEVTGGPVPAMNVYDIVQLAQKNINTNLDIISTIPTLASKNRKAALAHLYRSFPLRDLTHILISVTGFIGKTIPPSLCLSIRRLLGDCIRILEFGVRHIDNAMLRDMLERFRSLRDNFQCPAAKTRGDIDNKWKLGEHDGYKLNIPAADHYKLGGDFVVAGEEFAAESEMDEDSDAGESITGAEMAAME